MCDHSSDEHSQPLGPKEEAVWSCKTKKQMVEQNEDLNTRHLFAPSVLQTLNIDSGYNHNWDLSTIPVKAEN